MNTPIFITGIGTAVGKTICSAIVTEALAADYWKPIQAGFEEGTDAATVAECISNTITTIHPETYKLAMPASPHIAAKAEGVSISMEKIMQQFRQFNPNKPLVMEGAGGMLVPINETQFVVDMIKAVQAKVILVSRNYLGSINHSLLTAAYCKQHQIPVLGWLFNDQYLNYEAEIVAWSGYPAIGSIPPAQTLSKAFIRTQAEQIRPQLVQLLASNS
jgi:dethiobiotin synthetase